MKVPVAPYLDLLRKELVATLRPQQGDENARRVGEYAHKILTALWVENTSLPKIHAHTMREFEKMIPQMKEALGDVPGSMVLKAELVENITVSPNWYAAQQTMQNVVRLLYKNGSEQAKEVLQAIARINADGHSAHLGEIKSAYLQPACGESEPNCLPQTEAVSLQNYLRRRSPGDFSLKVIGSKMIVGGGSKATYVIELADAGVLPSCVILRKDSASSVQQTTLSNEYAILEAVHAAGLPTPKPYFLELDADVIGAPFVIVSLVSGHNIGDWNVVHEPSREFAIGVADALAKLHNMPIGDLSKVLPGSDISTKMYMKRLIDEFEENWRCHGEPSAAIEQAYLWLKDHLDFAEGQRSILHCDVGCHNMLGKNGKLTALLDWETAEVGNPARELTYVETHIAQMMPWDEFLNEYRQAGGKIPSQQEIDFYRMWRAVFRIHYLFIARSYLYAGLSSSMVHAYATQHMFHEAEQDIHDNVKLVYERYP